MPYPQDWNLFCKWRTAQTNLPDGICTKDLNRFAARYRLAKNFKGLTIERYRDITVKAYGAVMQTFLAFSALEQLHSAIKKHSSQQQIIKD